MGGQAAGVNGKALKCCIDHRFNRLNRESNAVMDSLVEQWPKVA